MSSASRVSHLLPLRGRHETGAAEKHAKLRLHFNTFLCFIVVFVGLSHVLYLACSPYSPETYTLTELTLHEVVHLYMLSL